MKKLSLLDVVVLPYGKEGESYLASWEPLELAWHLHVASIVSYVADSRHHKAAKAASRWHLGGAMQGTNIKNFRNSHMMVIYNYIK